MEGNTVVYLTPQCQVIFLFHKRLREIKKFIAFRDHYLNFLAQFPKCSVTSFKQRSESEKRELIISDSNYFENRFEVKLFNGLIGLMEKWTVQFY